MVNATNFDGSTDYSLRGGGLTGAVDGKSGFCSFWFKPDALSGNQTLLDGQTTRLSILLIGARLRFLARNTGGTQIVLIDSDTDLTVGVWQHALITWTAGGALGIWVDDTDHSGTITTNLDQDIDYTLTDWAIGARSDSFTKYAGCQSELYLNLNTVFDPTVTENRRKFISADLGTVDLGADGSLPTGTAPIGYFPNPFDTFGTNAGTGGNFADQGSVAACADAPPVAAPPTSGLALKPFMLPNRQRYAEESEARAAYARLMREEARIRAIRAEEEKETARLQAQIRAKLRAEEKEAERLEARARAKAEAEEREIERLMAIEAAKPKMPPDKNWKLGKKTKPKPKSSPPRSRQSLLDPIGWPRLYKD